MSDDSNRWDELRKLGEADPQLLELTIRARDALDELAIYLAEKARQAGVAVPADVREAISRPQRQQG